MLKTFSFFILEKYLLLISAVLKWLACPKDQDCEYSFSEEEIFNQEGEKILSLSLSSLHVDAN